MAKTIAYMITWTTYGTWLQGDKRGFVKDGEILLPNQSLVDSNKRSLKKEPVKLSGVQRQIAQITIIEKARKLNQRIYALSVRSNHVHIVAEYIPKPIGLVVRHYKNSVQVALRKMGLSGEVWTKGFDKGYCFNPQTLESRIKYVNRHNENLER